MTRTLFVMSAALLLSACATQYKRDMTPEDRAAIGAVAGKHMQCLGEKTALYIAGSDDVAFLVKHIVLLCDPVLDELDREIQGRGFSPHFSKGYLRASREKGVKETTSFILKEKTKQSRNSDYR